MRVAVPELDSCGENKGGRHLVLGIGEYWLVMPLGEAVLICGTGMAAELRCNPVGKIMPPGSGGPGRLVDGL